MDMSSRGALALFTRNGLRWKIVLTNCYKVSKGEILLAWDESLNPGPVKDPCGNCHVSVKGNWICCDRCDFFYHIRHINIHHSSSE